jgi:transcriptional regulator with PAS, ATPase and Fis domain
MAEITVLSPFAEFTNLVKAICYELGEDVDIIDAYGDQVLGIARELEHNGCKALVARKFTAAHLKTDHLSIPIIDLKITPFDLLQQLLDKTARKNVKKVGFIFYSEELFDYDIDAFERILGLDIVALPYHLPGTDISSSVKRAIQNNVDLVLTTGICIARKCWKNGLKAEVVYPSRNSVLEGIQRAKETLAAYNRYIEHVNHLQSVINFACDGMLVTDSAGRIVTLNSKAREIFEAYERVEGRPLAEISEYLQTIEENQENLTSIRGRQLVVKKTPLKAVEGKSWGALVTLKDVSEVQRLDQEIRAKNKAKGLLARFTIDDIIGTSPAVTRLKQRIRHYAKSSSAVLITGESGTGKEMVAQSMHNLSSRREGPFVAINCACLPETLLESELFGYEQGAFTGAEKKGKAGLFELAQQGTIFLDEIGEMPFPLQAKLLRVLQEKEVRRLGSDRNIPIEVRVFASTNRDLVDDVRQGAFRQDLFFRLNVLNLEIPPLRERKEDIAILANRFIDKFNLETEKTVPHLSELQRCHLEKNEWNGNIRELENVIERYVLLYGSEEDDGHLLQKFVASDRSHLTKHQNLPEVLEIQIGTLREMELEILSKLLEYSEANRSKVAELLGISRTTLWKRLKVVG